jgi:UDP-glucose 4-epimerase
MDWNKQHVLVTGGASFIGSHLVDALLERGATMRVVDDLSSGTLENIWHGGEPRHDGAGARL